MVRLVVCSRAFVERTLVPNRTSNQSTQIPRTHAWQTIRLFDDSVSFVFIHAHIIVWFFLFAKHFLLNVHISMEFVPQSVSLHRTFDCSIDLFWLFNSFTVCVSGDVIDRAIDRHVLFIAKIAVYIWKLAPAFRRDDVIKYVDCNHSTGHKTVLSDFHYEINAMLWIRTFAFGLRNRYFWLNFW